MSSRLLPALVALGFLSSPAFFISPALAGPLKIGQAAPAFTGTDSNGKTVKLSDFKGKTVVLEWTNNGCPYVGKWYSSGAMQALQSDAARLGAVWLTVVSSARGEQGYVDGPAANRDTASRNAHPTHVLLDSSGTIGRLYDAQTTPQIVIIRKDGTVAYSGGADSIASTRVEDLKTAEPYAREALEAVVAGKSVPHPVTRPYGCTVKYSS
ncbi:MAG TPA: redoxin domain-containing protein [Methylovirgula sp.]|nr:redoxin domain-containing protein [Methylovirgula sp.]